MALSLCFGAAFGREHKEDPVAESAEIPHAVGVPFQDLDPVVTSLCEPVRVGTEAGIGDRREPVPVCIRTLCERGDITLLRFFDSIRKQLLLLIRIVLAQDRVELFLQKISGGKRRGDIQHNKDLLPLLRLQLVHMLQQKMS